MKTLLSIVAIMATITVADAKQGIGYDNFNKAISYKYWAEKFGFQGEVSTNYIGVKNGTAYSSDASYMNLNLTALFLYPVAKADKFHLNAIGGVSYIMQTNIDQIEGKKKTDIGIRLGLSPEYFVTDNFSFECCFGLAISMNGETMTDTIGDGKAYKDLTTFGSPMSISGSTGLAFHFYFPEVVKAATESTPVETPEEEDEE